MEDIFVAVLAFAGTAIGTLGGIMASNKLVTFRLQKLEEKVDRHNTLIERTYKLEGRMDAVEDKIGGRI